MLLLENIVKASQVIDLVFLNSPYLQSDALNHALGARLWLKVETLNPIRSFKGRGTDFALQQLGADATKGIVAASAGNFGQGLAYAGRKRGIPVIIFASLHANPLKLEAMRAFGAEVRLSGEDFDAAKAAAQAHASETQQLFLEDGAYPAIAEGAGTMAQEMTEAGPPLEAILVPLGNGSLVNGVGAWMKAHSPQTQVVAIAAAGAPAMEHSWREGRVMTTETVNTIADGVAVRLPVPEALELMKQTVDQVRLVSEASIQAAMALAFEKLGLIVEPAGCLGLAALLENPLDFQGKQLATILCGSNITKTQAQQWIFR